MEFEKKKEPNIWPFFSLSLSHLLFEFLLFCLRENKWMVNGHKVVCCWWWSMMCIMWMCLVLKKKKRLMYTRYQHVLWSCLFSFLFWILHIGVIESICPSIKLNDDFLYDSSGSGYFTTHQSLKFFVLTRAILIFEKKFKFHFIRIRMFFFSSFCSLVQHAWQSSSSILIIYHINSCFKRNGIFIHRK